MKQKTQIGLLWLALVIVLVVGLVGWFLPSSKKNQPYLKAGSLIYYGWEGPYSKAGCYRIKNSIIEKPNRGTCMNEERYNSDYGTFYDDWFRWFGEDVRVIYRVP